MKRSAMICVMKRSAMICVTGLGLLSVAALSLGAWSPKARTHPSADPLPAPGLVQQTATNQAEPSAGIAPYVTWFGPDSAVEKVEYARIIDETQWAKFWEKNTGKPAARDNKSAAFIPRVDFSRCMVIAIFQGRTHNSNGVTCESVRDDGDRLVFRFDEDTYQTASFNGPDPGVSVTPYGLFVLPRSNQAVVLEENVQDLLNQPPIWKERVRLEALPANSR